MIVNWFCIARCYKGQKYVNWVLAAVSYVHLRKADLFFSKKVSDAACLLPRADRRKCRGMGSDLFLRSKNLTRTGQRP
jgi:hypothetical protein